MRTALLALAGVLLLRSALLAARHFKTWDVRPPVSKYGEMSEDSMHAFIRRCR